MRGILAGLFVVLFPYVAFAQQADVCIVYSCRGSQQGETTYRGIDVTIFERSYAQTCTCTTKLHIPTANEIGAGISTNIRKDIVDAIAAGTEAAFLKIEAANAQRQKEMIDLITTIKREQDKEIKLLKELVISCKQLPAQKPKPAATRPKDAK